MKYKNKLYFIASTTTMRELYVGVEKKINSQVRTFQKTFNVETIDVSFARNTIFHKILIRVPFTSSFGEWNKLNKIDDEGVIYLRYLKSDFQFIRFLKSFKYFLYTESGSSLAST